MIIPSVPADYQLSETVQYTTLFIAAGVVALMLIGVAAVCRDLGNRWSIEDAEADIDEMTQDLFIGRDQHWDDVRDSLPDRCSQ